MSSPVLRIGSPLRLLPGNVYSGRAHIVLERAVRVYSRNWLLLLTGFVEPLFYLFAIGTGLQGLVGTVVGPGGQVLGYTAFIAPALLATSAMNGAIYDSTMNVFFKMTFAKLYDSMLATSLGPLDVALGEIAWALIRGGLYAFGFLVVIAALGLVTSWWALLVLPAALLIAFGFAAVGMAATTWMTSVNHLDLIQLVTLPLFLFSGTFYELSVYPRWLQIVIECLPLHHGIELLRALDTGYVTWALLGHAAYFVVTAAAGLIIAARRLDVLLLR